MGLIGCSKQDQPKNEVTENPPQSVIESKRVGSLANSSANSPNNFYDEMVNGRSQFSNRIEQLGDDTFKQTISNDTGTINVVLTWKKTSAHDWENTMLIAKASKEADQDSFMAYMRLPYRLEDYNQITAILAQTDKKTITSILANGANLLVERDPEEDRITIQ